MYVGRWLQRTRVPPSVPRVSVHDNPVALLLVFQVDLGRHEHLGVEAALDRDPRAGGDGSRTHPPRHDRIWDARVRAHADLRAGMGTGLNLRRLPFGVPARLFHRAGVPCRSRRYFVQ